ncbi:MAG: 50S ribosomal protein L19 [Deltaproteobacteria bacterium]
MDAIKYVQDQLIQKNDIPEFRPGDNISVSYKIIEGNKERIQVFKGDVIRIQGEGATKVFTVRRIASGVGVERTFPYNSPNVGEVIVNKRGKVRRAKLYYLRDLTGKKARIKEKKIFKI